jgi:hypothetical protein
MRDPSLDFYLRTPTIRSLWEPEVATGSYHGLTLDIILGHSPKSPFSAAQQVPENL